MDRILCLPIGFPKPALDPRSLNEKVDNSVKHISYDGGSGGGREGVDSDVNILRAWKFLSHIPLAKSQDS